MNDDKRPRFRDVSPRVEFPELDARILSFWRERRIFEKSLALREDAPLFVFYEGPPTANGRPGAHHVLSRVFKDIFPRYKTMRGFKVAAQGGLGHARPTRRARDRAPAGHQRQEGDRGVRHRRVQPSLQGERPHLPRGVGPPDRAHRLLDRPRRRLLHVHQRVHRDGVVAAAPDLGQGPPLPGVQGRALLSSLRHGHLEPRGVAGLPGDRRAERLRALPAARGGRRAARRRSRRRRRRAKRVSPRRCSSGPRPPGR